MIDFEKLRTFYNFGKEFSLADIQVLLKTSRKVSIRKKIVLFEQGSTDTTMYFLQKGLVRMYHVNEQGEITTFNLIPEYHVVANFEFISTNLPSSFYYETVEDCSFFSMDYTDLESIIQNNVILEANRKFILRKLLMKTLDRVKSFVLLNPEERYLKFIKDHPDLINRVPDKYIAHMLGITPVSLSRIRKRITQ